MNFLMLHYVRSFKNNIGDFKVEDAPNACSRESVSQVIRLTEEVTRLTEEAKNFKKESADEISVLKKQVLKLTNQLVSLNGRLSLIPTVCINCSE